MLSSYYLLHNLAFFPKIRLKSVYRRNTISTLVHQIWQNFCLLYIHNWDGEAIVEVFYITFYIFICNFNTFYSPVIVEKWVGLNLTMTNKCNIRLSKTATNKSIAWEHGQVNVSVDSCCCFEQWTKEGCLAFPYLRVSSWQKTSKILLRQQWEIHHCFINNAPTWLSLSKTLQSTLTLTQEGSRQLLFVVKGFSRQKSTHEYDGVQC
jgi:hypothetical protein